MANRSGPGGSLEGQDELNSFAEDGRIDRVMEGLHRGADAQGRDSQGLSAVTAIISSERVGGDKLSTIIGLLNSGARIEGRYDGGYIDLLNNTAKMLQLLDDPRLSPVVRKKLRAAYNAYLHILKLPKCKDLADHVTLVNMSVKSNPVFLIKRILSIPTKIFDAGTEILKDDIIPEDLKICFTVHVCRPAIKMVLNLIGSAQLAEAAAAAGRPYEEYESACLNTLKAVSDGLIQRWFAGVIFSYGGPIGFTRPYKHAIQAGNAPVAIFAIENINHCFAVIDSEMDRGSTADVNFLRGEIKILASCDGFFDALAGGLIVCGLIPAVTDTIYKFLRDYRAQMARALEAPIRHLQADPARLPTPLSKSVVNNLIRCFEVALPLIPGAVPAHVGGAAAVAGPRAAAGAGAAAAAAPAPAVAARAAIANSHQAVALPAGAASSGRAVRSSSQGRSHAQSKSPRASSSAVAMVASPPAQAQPQATSPHAGASRSAAAAAVVATASSPAQAEPQVKSPHVKSPHEAPLRSLRAVLEQRAAMAKSPIAAASSSSSTTSSSVGAIASPGGHQRAVRASSKGAAAKRGSPKADLVAPGGVHAAAALKPALSVTIVAWLLALVLLFLALGLLLPSV